MSESLVARAKAFAEKAHASQKRYGKDDRPYVEHLAEVVELVTIAGGTEIDIAAAWLHDVLEDTGATKEDLEREFNELVSYIVVCLTDLPHIAKLPTLQRKKAQALRVAGMKKRVRKIKLADQISNLRSIASDPPTHWNVEKCRDYILGAQYVAASCAGLSLELDREYEKAITAAIVTHM